MLVCMCFVYSSRILHPATEVKPVWILKHEEDKKRAVPYGVAFTSAKQILVPGKEKLQLK